MKTCETKKKIYPSAAVAEDALISAWTAYDYRNQNGPIDVYLCDICRNYHLTSKGEMNKKLAEYLSSPQWKKDVEANRWVEKLKNKRWS
jgi:hypothetical protein